MYLLSDKNRLAYFTLKTHFRNLSEQVANDNLYGKNIFFFLGKKIQSGRVTIIFNYITGEMMMNMKEERAKNN